MSLTIVTKVRLRKQPEILFLMRDRKISEFNLKSIGNQDNLLSTQIGPLLLQQAPCIATALQNQ